MNKQEYIKNLASVLVSNNTTMTGEELAGHLNKIGFSAVVGV